MRRKLLLTLLLLAGMLRGLSAQNVSDLIISEVLAEPDSTGFTDDFGRRSGWIEIYNTSTGTVNFGGCYLTDDLKDLRKSQIPKNDLRTKLGARQVALLFTSGDGSDGTFYAGFTLSPGKTVYLVSNDGKTVVDSLSIPKDLAPGESVSKHSTDPKLLSWTSDGKGGRPTPMVRNGDQNAETNAQVMARKDPHGWILSLVSVSVVFAALAILWFLFRIFFELPARRAAAPAKAKPAAKSKSDIPDDETAAAIALALDMENGGDTYAAIALAMDLYFNDTVHDSEPYVLTMRPGGASQWNDKKLNFRKLPR